MGLIQVIYFHEIVPVHNYLSFPEYMNRDVLKGTRSPLQSFLLDESNLIT
jgi:hypothetical protein